MFIDSALSRRVCLSHAYVEHMTQSLAYNGNMPVFRDNRRYTLCCCRVDMSNIQSLEHDVMMRMNRRQQQHHVINLYTTRQHELS